MRKLHLAAAIGVLNRSFESNIFSRRLFFLIRYMHVPNCIAIEKSAGSPVLDTCDENKWSNEVVNERNLCGTHIFRPKEGCRKQAKEGGSLSKSGIKRKIRDHKEKGRRKRRSSKR